MPDVRLPDGRIIKNVPEGITKSQLTQRLEKFDAPKETPAPQKTEEPLLRRAARLSQESLRPVDLGVRALLQGVSAPVTIGADVLGAGVNLLAGREVIPSLGGMVSETLTDVGFPEPRTPTERVGSALVEGATGGLGVSQGVKAATKPLVGAVSGATGAGAASVAGELGATPQTQLIAGLAGGAAGGRAATRLAQPKPTAPAILEDVAERGIEGTAAFSNLREGLQKEAKTLREEFSGVPGGKKGLFDEAKERGQDVFVKNESISQLSKNIREQIVTEIDSEAKTVLGNTANIFDELIATKPKITLNDIETIRRSATKVSQSGGSKGFIGGDIRQQIDNLLEDSKNITGDEKAVAIWKKAITKRREFGQKFEKPQEIAKSLTDKTNEEIAQTFIGSGGAALNKGLSRVYDDTLSALPKGKKTEAGFQLRQSIINRWIKNAAQSVDDAEGVSASRLSNQIRNFRRDNKSMWDKFNGGEKKILNDLEVSLRKTAEGGFINKAYSGLQRFISSSIRSNVELPRTLKPKTVVTIDDLVELTNFKPSFISKTAPVIVGAEIGADSQ